MSTRNARRGTAVLTAGLHLVALLLYLSSGLLAPGWAVVILLAMWVLLAWAAVALHRRYGALALLVPLGAIAIWFGVMTLGDLLLGWTA